MIYVEMSRTERHGGGDWAFPKCVWSPSHKTNNHAWTYWNKILEIEKGDIVFHLRGKMPLAKFVGYSIASSNGYKTTDRPPEAEIHDYASSFFRADLTEFTKFKNPIKLIDIFIQKGTTLESYYDKNKTLKEGKENLFFVRQVGKLRCQNGAYISDVSDKLYEILFGKTPVKHSSITNNIVSVATRSQLKMAKVRIGQKKFSDEVKKNYDNKCCFPYCDVQDSRFLIGAHIDRWSDNKSLRGHIGNGLCFCLLHDKAFEIGMFTLDAEFNVLAYSKGGTTITPIMQNILKNNGKPIFTATVPPMEKALKAHWKRIKI